MMELVDPDRSWLLEVEEGEDCLGAVPMVPVSSSAIAQVGYANGTLLVEFQNGSCYRYDDVPVDTFEGLVEAESAGQYFAQEVKGQFEYTRL